MVGSFSSKIPVLFVIFLGLTLATVAGTAVSEENYFLLVLILTLVFGLGYLTIVGSRYWVIIPFAIYSGLPAIPLGARALELGELAIAACAAIFIANIAIKQQRVVIYRPLHLPVLIFISWVGLTWMFNPVGLLIFGSQTVGGRFYLKLALAFLSFLIMASQKPSDKDIKVIILTFICATLLNVVYSLWSFHSGVASGMVSISPDEEFYTWHQVLSWPAVIVASFIFSRYKVSEVLKPSRWYLFLLYILCVVLALSSGKRMGVAGVLITPVLAAFMHREYRMVFVALIGAVFFLIVVIVGHGSLFTFPKTVQRALSFLPAEWDESFQHMQAGNDVWRAKIREYAWDIVRENPIFTKGYALDLNDLVASVYASESMDGLEYQVLWAVAGRAWHNTWLGYTADFGLPVTVAQAALWIVLLFASLKVVRMTQAPLSYRWFSGFVFLFVCRDIIASHTSGQTALDAFNRWWMYGLFFAIYYVVKPLVVEKKQAKFGEVPYSFQTLPAQRDFAAMQRNGLLRNS